MIVDLHPNLPSGRKSRLRLKDGSPPKPHKRRLPWTDPPPPPSIGICVQVEGGGALTRADVDALACAIVNASVKRRRQQGCKNPFAVVRTVSEVCAELKKTLHPVMRKPEDD